MAIGMPDMKSKINHATAIAAYNLEAGRYRKIVRQWELLKDQNTAQGKALLNRIVEKNRLLTKLKAQIPEHLFKPATK